MQLAQSNFANNLQTARTGHPHAHELQPIVLTGLGSAGSAHPNGRTGRRDPTEPDSTEHSLDRND